MQQRRKDIEQVLGKSQPKLAQCNGSTACLPTANGHMSASAAELRDMQLSSGQTAECNGFHKAPLSEEESLKERRLSHSSAQVPGAPAAASLQTQICSRGQIAIAVF